MFVIRLVLLPVRVLLAVVGVTFRGGYLVGRAPVKAGATVARLPGWRGWFFLVVGVGLGLLLAPVPGRDLRARVRRMLAGETDDGELRDKVAFELAHAPRTWHLPQPDVRAEGGRIILTGAVANATDGEELARVAGSIPGVRGVDNLLGSAPHG